MQDRPEALRVISPAIDSTYLLDPDVPTSSRIPLAAVGGTKLVWQGNSLHCAKDNGGNFALAQEGEHQICVTDTETEASATVTISVRPL